MTQSATSRRRTDLDGPPAPQADRIGASLAAALGGVLCLPFIFGTSIPGRADLGYHATLLDGQWMSWAAYGRPSAWLPAGSAGEHFVHLPTAYAATDYAYLGLLRAVLPIGFAVGVAVGAAWAAMSWGAYRLARAARLGPVESVCVAALTTFSGWSISTFSARTAVAELVSIGAFFAAVGATATLWTNADRRGAALPACVGAAMFAGGHPPTLAWMVVLGGVAVVVSWVVIRPTADAIRWSALVPAAVGTGCAMWQWPMALTVWRNVRTPRATEYLDNRYFFEPFGTGSGPSVRALLAPWRPSLGDGALAPYHVAVPLIPLVIVSCVCLVAARRADRRRLTVGACFAAAGAALIALPHAERVARHVTLLGSLQYHWRIVTYGAIALTGGALVVLSDPAVRAVLRRRSVTAVLAVAIAVDVGFGVAQAIHSWPDVPGATRRTDVAEAIELAPTPVLRNDDSLLRDRSLPIREEVVESTARALVSEGDRSEAPVTFEVPADDEFLVPIIATGPFVEWSEELKPVAWARSPEERSDANWEGRQLWLLVERGEVPPGTRVTVRPARSALTTFTRCASWSLLVGPAAVTWWSWRQRRPRGHPQHRRPGR